MELIVRRLKPEPNRPPCSNSHYNPFRLEWVVDITTLDELEALVIENGRCCLRRHPLEGLTITIEEGPEPLPRS